MWVERDRHARERSLRRLPWCHAFAIFRRSCSVDAKRQFLSKDYSLTHFDNQNICRAWLVIRVPIIKFNPHIIVVAQFLRCLEESINWVGFHARSNSQWCQPHPLPWSIFVVLHPVKVNLPCRAAFHNAAHKPYFSDHTLTRNVLQAVCLCGNFRCVKGKTNCVGVRK